jgi:hypothetical protein
VALLRAANIHENAMRISARNQINGTVVEVKKGATTSHIMRSFVFIMLALLGTAPVFAAEEPSGCDKFKWPIDHERAALTAPDRAKVTSGNELAALPSSGITLALVAPADAKLPTPPERAPKEGTFAGFTSIKTAPKAGLYTVSLSAGGWVDVVQDGHFLKPKAFSGATDCDGIRKTMKYELSASPLVLQVSGTKEDSISIAILPSE